MTLRVSILENFAELERRAPTLTAAYPDQDPFTCFGWYKNLYETAIAQEYAAQLFLIEDENGTPIACLPFVVQSPQSGDHRGRKLASLSNYYSSNFGPIQSREPIEQAQVYRLIARAIKSARPRFDFVEMRPLRGGTPFLSAMHVALEQEGFIASEFFCFGNWYLLVGKRAFGEYFASLPSTLRNTVLRKEKALLKLPDTSIIVEHEAGPGLDRAIADFNRVYARSWKKPEPFPEFIPGLCRFLAREGWLRLGVIRMGSDPIAAQIWIVKDRRALIYKLAYDEAHGKLSPGSVLTKRLVEYTLMNDKVEEIDYLTGDDAYKRDWMSHRRESIGLVAFNRSTLPGLILASMHFGARAGRALFGRKNTRP